MHNDLQSVADKLLTLKAEIQPVEAEIETLKGILAAATDTAGEPLRFASNLGMVETRRGSKKESKGYQPVFHPEAWTTLPETLRNRLKSAGMVTFEEQFTRESKPAVTIKPVKLKEAA